MPDPTAVPLDRTLTGQPVSVNSYTLTAVARLSGWEWGAPNDKGTGVFARLNPTEVRVTAPDGSESTVVLANASAKAVRGMLGAAGIVAAVSAVIILLARLWGWHRA